MALFGKSTDGEDGRTIGIASKSKLNEMGSHAVIGPSLRGVPFVVV